MATSPGSRLSSIRLTSKQGWVIRAWAAWTVYVWGTRLFNIWRDEARDLPFKVVHSVLAAVSVAFAVAGLLIVAKGRKAADADAAAPTVGPVEEPILTR